MLVEHFKAHKSGVIKMFNLFKPLNGFCKALLFVVSCSRLIFRSLLPQKFKLNLPFKRMSDKRCQVKVRSSLLIKCVLEFNCKLKESFGLSAVLFDREIPGELVP